VKGEGYNTVKISLYYIPPGLKKGVLTN